MGNSRSCGYDTCDILVYRFMLFCFVPIVVFLVPLEMGGVLNWVTFWSCMQILVLGGNGFVGTAICKRAVAQGISVVSLSRSGRPSILESWVDQVTWISGKCISL